MPRFSISVVQFCDRNDHVWPIAYKGCGVEVSLSNFTHVFPLLKGYVVGVLFVISVVHLIDAGTDKYSCYAPNNDNEDVKRI